VEKKAVNPVVDNQAAADKAAARKVVAAGGRVVATVNVDYLGESNKLAQVISSSRSI
jgi:hypothetical protein